MISSSYYCWKRFMIIGWTMKGKRVVDILLLRNSSKIMLSIEWCIYYFFWDEFNTLYYVYKL